MFLYNAHIAIYTVPVLGPGSMLLYVRTGMYKLPVVRPLAYLLHHKVYKQLKYVQDGIVIFLSSSHRLNSSVVDIDVQ